MMDAMTETSNPYIPPPTLSRKDVAAVLNCAPLTIRNQEKKGVFPEPTRGANNYRSYSLVDVLVLQHIYRHQVNIFPILSVLWDKGCTNPTLNKMWVDDAIEQFEAIVQQKSGATIGATSE